MLIIDNIKNLIECGCGTAYTFNEKDLRLVNPRMFGVSCPNCGQMSYVVGELSLEVAKGCVEIEGEIK